MSPKNYLNLDILPNEKKLAEIVNKWENSKKNRNNSNENKENRKKRKFEYESVEEGISSKKKNAVLLSEEARERQEKKAKLEQARIKEEMQKIATNKKAAETIVFSEELTDKNFDYMLYLCCSNKSNNDIVKRLKSKITTDLRNIANIWDSLNSKEQDRINNLLIEGQHISDNKFREALALIDPYLTKNPLLAMLSRNLRGTLKYDSLIESLNEVSSQYDDEISRYFDTINNTVNNKLGSNQKFFESKIENMNPKLLLKFTTPDAYEGLFRDSAKREKCLLGTLKIMLDKGAFKKEEKDFLIDQYKSWCSNGYKLDNMIYKALIDKITDISVKFIKFYKSLQQKGGVGEIMNVSSRKKFIKDLIEALNEVYSTLDYIDNYNEKCKYEIEEVINKDILFPTRLFDMLVNQDLTKCLNKYQYILLIIKNFNILKKDVSKFQIDDEICSYEQIKSNENKKQEIRSMFNFIKEKIPNSLMITNSNKNKNMQLVLRKNAPLQLIQKFTKISSPNYLKLNNKSKNNASRKLKEQNLLLQQEKQREENEETKLLIKELSQEIKDNISKLKDSKNSLKKLQPLIKKIMKQIGQYDDLLSNFENKGNRITGDKLMKRLEKALSNKK